MIECPNCRTRFEQGGPCPQCSFAPANVDGFEAWAPDFAHGGGGFKAEFFEALAAVEANNFWFRARNKLILWALSAYFPKFGSFMEVGCGTGFVLTGVSATFPQVRLVGSEIFTDGLRFAAERLPSARFLQMDARNIPYVEEFDVVAALDVIEHIREDELVLDNLFRALRPGGGLLISVPQHRWLWSDVDEVSHHQRRYTARELQSKVEAAGFEITRSTSFVSFLLPAMLLSRLRRRSVNVETMAEFRIGATLNRAMERVMTLERVLIRTGLNLPLGGSRLVVAIKPR